MPNITHAERLPDGSIRCLVTEEREVIISASEVAAKVKSEKLSVSDAIGHLVKAKLKKVAG